MSNTFGICASFEREFLQGKHDLATDTIKAALYLATASLSYQTTQYSATGEVSGLNYVAGGVQVLSSGAPLSSGKTTYWNPASDIIFSNVAISSPFNAALLYNASYGNKAIGVWTFTTGTAFGTFKLAIPANNKSQALIRISQ